MPGLPLSSAHSSSVPTPPDTWHDQPFIHDLPPYLPITATTVVDAESYIFQCALVDSNFDKDVDTFAVTRSQQKAVAGQDTPITPPLERTSAWDSQVDDRDFYKVVDTPMGQERG